jgi:hypothetical protein
VHQPQEYRITDGPEIDDIVMGCRLDIAVGVRKIIGLKNFEEGPDEGHPQNCRQQAFSLKTSHAPKIPRKRLPSSI